MEGWSFFNEQIKRSDKTGLIKCNYNNTWTVKQCRMSEVTGCGILKVFFS